MSFAIRRADIAIRFSQVRTLLNFISNSESPATPPVDTDEVRILRGLFYVHLYGAFEKSINDVVGQYLDVIEGVGISCADVAHEFYAVVFDPRFSSIRATDKLSKRIEFAKAIKSSDSLIINRAVFGDMLANVWSKTLIEISEAIGADGLYHRQFRDEHYVDEVVDKRNQVAHGRESPITVGSSGRSADLTLRFNAVFRVMDAFIQMVETHVASKSYIVGSRQNAYVAP